MRPLLAVAMAMTLAGCTLIPGEEATPYPRAILASDPFTDLIVEIDHAPGRQPSVAAREHLVKELRNVTMKTRVSVRMDASLADDESKRWTISDLIATEERTRSSQHEAPIALLHVLYPAGQYENASVAGITITGPAIPTVAVFLDTIDQLASPVGPIVVPRELVEDVERSTLLHEAGHAIGLVNNGLRMVKDHEDPDHEGHSSNPDSVMYWRVETLAGIREAFFADGGIPLYFDADDRADMRAAGGR